MKTPLVPHLRSLPSSKNTDAKHIQGIPMGRHIGLQVKRQWAWLVVEMVAVIGVVGIVGLGSLGLIVKGTVDFVSQFT